MNSVDNISGKLNINKGVSTSYSYNSPYVPIYTDLNSRDIFKPSGENKNTGYVQQSTTIPIISLYNPKQLLLAYSNPRMVNSIIENNPNIKELLQKKGLDPVIYPTNISNICNSHIDTTTYFANKIANQMNLPQNEKKLLEQACIFHDYGKILIPSELINKPDILTQDEKDIVDLHSQLGYELLADSGMSSRVLELIKNHHNPMSKNADVLGQILSVADIYSALREPRSYKEALSAQDAFKLLDQKASEGEVSTEVVNALKASLNSAKSA